MRKLATLVLIHFRTTCAIQFRWCCGVLRKNHCMGQNCFPWACVALAPDIAKLPDMRQFVQTQGPHSYAAVVGAIQESLRMVMIVTDSIPLQSGNYSVHVQKGPRRIHNHYVVLMVRDGVKNRVFAGQEGNPCLQHLRGHCRRGDVYICLR